jgi:IK cytokine
MQITKIGQRYACILSVCHAGADPCNDYAQVDAQRRYLGGDSDHSILVKGLDFALLEQNKARFASTSSKQDDDALEEVFAQTASTSSVPALKKRSRADIIKELKEKRASEGELGQSNEEQTAEKRVDTSKFRPIGFKPIGASTEKVKKKKGKEGSEPKKKKRKVESSAVDARGQANPKGTHTTRLAPVEHAVSTSASHQPIQPELEEEDDFDIFAEAGEYKGMEYGSDDDSDEGSEKGHERPPRPRISVAPAAEGVSAPPRKGWFDGEDGKEPEPEASPPSPPPAGQPAPVPEAAVEAEEEQLARLTPLNSSTMPSISDFLAMDEAVEKEEKRKARKEKRKGKNKGS